MYKCIYTYIYPIMYFHTLYQHICKRYTPILFIPIMLCCHFIKKYTFKPLIIYGIAANSIFTGSVIFASVHQKKKLWTHIVEILPSMLFILFDHPAGNVTLHLFYPGKDVDRTQFCATGL